MLCLPVQNYMNWVILILDMTQYYFFKSFQFYLLTDHGLSPWTLSFYIHLSMYLLVFYFILFFEMKLLTFPYHKLFHFYPTCSSQILRQALSSRSFDSCPIERLLEQKLGAIKIYLNLLFFPSPLC